MLPALVLSTTIMAEFFTPCDAASGIGARINVGLFDTSPSSTVPTYRLGGRRLGFARAFFRLGHAGFVLGRGWCGTGQCPLLGGVFLAGVAGQLPPRRLLFVTHGSPLGST